MVVEEEVVVVVVVEEVVVVVVGDAEEEEDKAEVLEEERVIEGVRIILLEITSLEAVRCKTILRISRFPIFVHRMTIPSIPAAIRLSFSNIFYLINR